MNKKEMSRMLEKEMSAALAKRDGVVMKKVWVGVWVNQARVDYDVFENVTMEEAVARARAVWALLSVATQVEIRKKQKKRLRFLNPFGPFPATQNNAKTEFFASSKYRESCTLQGIKEWRNTTP